MQVRLPKGTSRSLRHRDYEEIKKSALVCHEFKFSHPVFDWHFHEFLELCVISGGGGIRCVGDSTERFVSPEVVLLGEGLPHAWLPGSKSVHVQVAHVRPEALRSLAENVPEFSAVAKLLEWSRRGLHFHGAAAWLALGEIKKILAAPPSSQERFFLFLKLLGKLATSPERHCLSSKSWDILRPGSVLEGASHQKIKSVLTLIHNGEAVSRDFLSKRLSMAPGSFSRWFKAIMGKSFIDYLLSHRVAQASQLLEESEKSILEISQAVGFGNLSNFNRQFKLLTGKTPRDHRRNSWEEG